MEQRIKIVALKLTGPSDQPKIQLILIEKLKRLISRLAGNIDADLGMRGYIRLQVGKKHIPAKCGAGA